MNYIAQAPYSPRKVYSAQTGRLENQTLSSRRRPHQAVFYWLQITLVSFLLLSQFGIGIFTIGGRFIVEAAILCLIPIIAINKELRRSVMVIIRSRRFISGLLLLMVLFGAGAIVFQSAVAAYADFRCCVLLLFAYCITSTETRGDVKKRQILLHVTIATTLIGFLAAEVYKDTTIAKTQFNILACVIALYLLAKNRRPLAFLIMSGVSAYAAIVSFYRTYWLVVGLACICFGGLLVATSAKRGQIRRAVIIVAGLGFAVIVTIQSGIVESYLHSSEKRYIQSIGKTEKLLEAVTRGGEMKGGDDIRVGYFEFIIKYPATVFLPHGLGSRAAYGDVDPFFDQFAEFANTADSGLFYAVYHGGLIVVIPILCLFARRIAKRIRGRQMTERLYVLCGLLVFVAYVIPVGDLFVIVERGALAGAYLGMLVNRNC